MAHEDSPYLLVGLGNPGKEYRHTRHNIGFDCIELIQSRLSLPSFREKNNFEGWFSKGSRGDKELLLLAPFTYMNLSGRSVQKAASFYKIPTNRIVVFQDDLDLPLGKIRIKTEGGSGGHNGIKSIIATVGSDFIRVKIGIGRGKGATETRDHVLTHFSKADREIIMASIEQTPAIVELILQHGVTEAQNRFNG